MPQTFVLPKQVGFISGVIAPSSVLRFYQTGTATPQNVYTDAALTNAVTSITADAAGVFAKVYLNPSAAANYRVTLENSAGVVSYTEDDISRFPAGQTDIGAALYPRTAEEIAAAITPTNYFYPVLNVLRYGADATGVADSATAIQDAIDVADQYTNDGNGGGAVAYIPTGSYKLLTGLTVASANFIGIRGDGQFNSNLFPQGGITALTVKSRGLFTDFGIVGESKTDTNTGIGCASCTQTSFRSIRLRRLQNGAVMEDTFISRWYDPRFDGCANALVMLGTSDLGLGAGTSPCQDNKFFGGSWANNDYCIRLQGVRNTVFYGPNIEKNQYGVVYEGPASIENKMLHAWVESTHIPMLVNVTVAGSVSLNNEFSGAYIAMNGDATVLPGADTLADSRVMRFDATGSGFRQTRFADNFITLGSGATSTVGVEVDAAATPTYTICENNFWNSTLTYSGAQVSIPQGIRDTLFRRLRAVVKLSAVQSIADSTETSISWAAEDIDHGGWWDSGTPSQFTVPAGVRRVRVSAQVTWAANATGYRQLKIQKNSSDTSFTGRPDIMGLPVSGVVHRMQVSADLDVAANDLLRVRVLQTSGGALDVSADSGFGTYFSVEAID